MAEEKLGEASLDIVVDLASFEKQLQRARKITKRMADRMVKSLDRVGKKLTKIGRGLSTKLTAPVLLAGAAIGKVTATFDTSLTKIESLVGISSKQVREWRKDILALGPAVGRGPGELAEGMFFVTSSGFRGAEALDVLTTSAKAASIGLGSTASVAAAVGASVNAFGIESLSAGKSVGILIGAVREGQFEAEQFAQNIGNIIPLAAEMGVSFDQVSASIAAMTRLGASVPRSITAIDGVLRALLKTTPPAREAIEEMGLSLDDLRSDLRKPGGLLLVLDQLSEAVKTTDVEMSKIFPDTEALKGVLSLMGKNADVTRGIFQRLAKDGIGTLNRAFQITTKDAGFKFNQSLSRITTSMIRLGDVLLPVVTPIIVKFTKAIEAAAISFSKLSTNTKAIIVLVTAFAIALGPILITLGLLSIGMGIFITGITKLGVVLVATSKLIFSAFKLMLSGPGLIVIGITAIVTAFIVFQKTIIGLAKGIIIGIHKELVEKFHNNIIIPFVKALNVLIGLIPDFAKKALKEKGFDITALFVPDPKDNAFLDDMKVVFGEAFEQGKLDAADFQTALETILGDIGSSFTIGGGEGLFAGLEEQFNKIKALIDNFGKGGDGGESVPKVMAKEWQEAAESIKDNLGASLEDAILKMKSFGDVGRAVLQDILRHMLRLLVIKPLLDGLFKSFGFPIPGKKAGGGDISGPTLVGERGPEIIIPKGPSTVVNAADSRRRLGGNVVSITQNITFVTDVKNSVRAEIANAAPIIAHAATAEVFKNIARQNR